MNGTSSSASPATDGAPRVNIVQGEYHVSRKGDVVLTTLLGSCVAACMHDPVAKVGGMNHFLLPNATGGGAGEARYGVHAMELLVNGLLKVGARRDRLQVWLFGGAQVLDRVTDIGGKNAEFAESFVKSEEFKYVGGSLRGTKARRVQFWPGTGRVRQLSLSHADVGPAVFQPPPPKVVELGNDVELF